MRLSPLKDGGDSTVYSPKETIMDYSELAKGHLDVVVENKIATVTMNRPERLNAFIAADDHPQRLCV